MEQSKVRINRAPVLTLWAAVVAERLGYSQEEALTLGRAVAGMNAQSKAQRLGIVRPDDSNQAEEEQGDGGESRKRAEPEYVSLLGRSVPVASTVKGLRALSKDRPMDARGVKRYLERKFGEQLPAVRSAMQTLAETYPPETLAGRAYGLYEKFRPQIPEGARGWGAEGELDLDLLEQLKKQP